MVLLTSGSCGVKDGKFIEGTVQDRARLAFENVRALLNEENLDLQDGKIFFVSSQRVSTCVMSTGS